MQSPLNYLPLVSGNVVAMLATLGVTIYVSLLLAAVDLSVLPALFIVTYWMRRRIAPATWEAREVERVAAAAGTLHGSRMLLIRL